MKKAKCPLVGFEPATLQSAIDDSGLVFLAFSAPWYSGWVVGPTFNRKIALSGGLCSMSGQNHLSNRFLFDFFRSTRRRQILDIFCGSFRHFCGFPIPSKLRPKVSVSSSESFFKKVSFFSVQRKKIVRNRHKRHFFRFGRKKNFRDFFV